MSLGSNLPSAIAHRANHRLGPGLTWWGKYTRPLALFHVRKEFDCQTVIKCTRAPCGTT
jgi:hypothetical protein